MCLDANKFVLLSFFSLTKAIYPKAQPNHCPMMEKVHFRLTSVAQKRCCLSSLWPLWFMHQSIHIQQVNQEFKKALSLSCSPVFLSRPPRAINMFPSPQSNETATYTGQRRSKNGPQPLFQPHDRFTSDKRSENETEIKLSHCQTLKSYNS